ncbi:MAG: caspase family protein [SAR324 cluster bacterium]|nr:caspase family protein [SAR324 cluster bacterium]
MKLLSTIFLIFFTLGTVYGQSDDGRSLRKVYEERRIALVIGNTNYETSPLRNPIHDAESIARVLRERRFDVTLLTDVNQRGMVRAIQKFGKNLKGGGIGLFYYAGHGMQIKGRNYLIPLETNIETEGDIEFESVDVGRVLNQMESAENRLNIVILDACRDNPFARSFRSSSKGLAQMDSPSGTLIAYATAPGKTAADGDGKNGIYTENLLQQMQVPGLEIAQMFKKVRAGVNKATSNLQTPWEASSITGDFYFTPAQVASVAPTQTTMSPPATMPLSINVEQEAWDQVKDSDDPEVVRMFLQRYPNSKLAFPARLKLEQLLKLPENSTPTAGKPTKIEEIRHNELLRSVAQAIHLHSAQNSDAGHLVRKYVDVYGVDRLQNELSLAAEEQYKLGVIYREGLGIDQNNQQAIYWYTKAAEQDHAAAQTRLGYMFRKGYGIFKDNSQAVYWYKRAAGQGDAQGQFNLGGMYLKGYGVSKDKTQAIFYYRKAAQQGHKIAQRMLNRLK